MALGVGEVGRNGDNRVGDVLAEVCLSIALEFHQGAGADLLGGVVLTVDVDGPFGAHVPLDRAHRAINIGDGLALGDLADQYFTVLREGHDRRGRPGAFRICNNDGFAAFEDRYDRVGRTKVNTYCSGHDVRTPL